MRWYEHNVELDTAVFDRVDIVVRLDNEVMVYYGHSLVECLDINLHWVHYDKQNNAVPNSGQKLIC